MFVYTDNEGKVQRNLHNMDLEFIKFKYFYNDDEECKYGLQYNHHVLYDIGRHFSNDCQSLQFKARTWRIFFSLWITAKNLFGKMTKKKKPITKTKTHTKKGLAKDIEDSFGLLITNLD